MNRNCLHFQSSDFEPLFQLFYQNNERFKISYDKMNETNFYQADEGYGCKKVIDDSLIVGKIHDLIIDYIENIKVKRNLKFQLTNSISNNREQVYDRNS